jgi:ComF family protein
MTVGGVLAERVGRIALDLLFPARCIGCGAGGSFVCEACAATLPLAMPSRCARCWRPGVGGVCESCRADPPPFDGLVAAYVYSGLARELVHHLKYREATALAAPMASLLTKAVAGRLPQADLIVPVPLSGLRRRTRGYNQSEALARALGRELELLVSARALSRRRHTPPQARSAGAEERRRNVEGAFEARAGEVASRRVLLLDDVTTTGATLRACAAALRSAGARSVWALAFARED